MFQTNDKKYMVSEALEDCELAFAEAAYQDLGQQTPMGFMDSGGEYHQIKNYYHWLDQKHPSFTILTFSENTKWETADMCMACSSPL